MITGTSHFVSRSHAIHYYHAYEATYSDAVIAVSNKLAAGEIHIGKPVLKAGERLITIDGGDRYAIESEG